MISKNSTLRLRLFLTFISFTCLNVLNAEVSALENIDIIYTEQDAQGATINDMTPQFLENYSNYSLSRVKYHMRKIHGLTQQSEINLKHSHSYAEIDGLKLGVVRMNSNSDSSVTAFSIIGDNLYRVFCSHRSIEIIPITYGKCGEKIKEHIIETHDKYVAQEVVNKVFDYHFGSERTPNGMPLSEVDRLFKITQELDKE